MQNGHDAKVHTLNPIGTGICQAKKLAEVHPQTSHDTHYSPRYLIPQFPLKDIMLNMLLYRCCAAQINSSRKSGRGAVMRLFIKQSIAKRKANDHCEANNIKRQSTIETKI